MDHGRNYGYDKNGVKPSCCSTTNNNVSELKTLGLWKSEQDKESW